MKRFVSLDLLRGGAIVGVLFFHMLNVAFNYGGLIAGDIAWPLYPLLIFVGYVSQMDIIFVVLSGLVNTISIDKQWKRLAAGNPTADQKRVAANKILKSQLVRGLFIYAMAYISETLLNGLLLRLIVQAPNPLNESVGSLYYTNILQAIAWGIIISGVLYTQLLRQERGREWVSKRLLIAVLAILILTPFMVMLSRTFPGFYDSWTTRDLGWNILYAIINPIFRRGNPLFPFAVFGIVGTMIGCRISDGNLDKADATRWFAGSVAAFVGGALLYVPKVAGLHTILNLKAPALPYYFIASVYDVGENLMVMGGSMLLMLLILYLIDFRGHTKWFAKRTAFIRRFGLVSLTVWSLQWTIAVLAMAYNGITNAITGSATPFLESDFVAGCFDFEHAEGLTGGEFWFWWLITFAAFHTFMRVWERAGFRGSFEWVTIKLMSIGRKDVSERLNMSASLYNVESLVENPQSYWGKGKIIAICAVFFVMALIYVALTMLF